MRLPRESIDTADKFQPLLQQSKREDQYPKKIEKIAYLPQILISLPPTFNLESVCGYVHPTPNNNYIISLSLFQTRQTFFKERKNINSSYS